MKNDLSHVPHLKVLQGGNADSSLRAATQEVAAPLLSRLATPERGQHVVSLVQAVGSNHTGSNLAGTNLESPPHTSPDSPTKCAVARYNSPAEVISVLANTLSPDQAQVLIRGFGLDEVGRSSPRGRAYQEMMERVVLDPLFAQVYSDILRQLAYVAQRKHTEGKHTGRKQTDINQQGDSQNTNNPEISPLSSGQIIMTTE